MTNQDSRDVLPIPDRPYEGELPLDAKEPEATFPPIQPLLAPAGAPNVLVVLLDDVVNLAAAMQPGSTAGVLIWENLWAAPFAAAARRSGGQLIANGRIPIQAIIASIEADEAPATEGD